MKVNRWVLTVLLTGCSGGSTLTEADVEKVLRAEVPGTKSVKVISITDTKDKVTKDGVLTGCNPMFDKSTYAARVVHTADFGECPRLKTLFTICGVREVEKNLCFKRAEDGWVYKQGDLVIPGATPTPQR